MSDPESILPPNATGLERALELVAASRIDGIASPLRSLWDPATIPSRLLPWLAFALSIDEWDPTWPIAVRRARVAAAIDVQRRKGTLSAVRSVIAALGGQARIVEWWQTTPKGDPYTFTVELALPSDGTAPPRASLVNSVTAEIERTKPLRSRFNLVLAVNAVASVGLRAVARPATFARLSVRAGADTAPIPPGGLTLRNSALSLGGDPLTLGV